LNDDEGLFDRGFDDTGPFRVSPESGGVSLETALRDFGPAAIDDLIPRLRAIARRLDAAHRAGLVHGALHPSKVFVNDDATSVIAGSGARVPYAAPEVVDGHGATALSDQYSLAAIAYEWLFGRPIAHAGDRPIEVRAMPGVDRQALSKAFTRALAQQPGDRFASCGAFCEAFAGAVVPELPLLAHGNGHSSLDAEAVALADAADVDDFEPEDESAPPVITAADLAQPQPPLNVEDAKIAAEESIITAAEPDLSAMAPPFEPPLAPPAAPPAPAFEPPLAVPVPAWDPPVLSQPSRATQSPRFGPFALFFALIVGAVFGFAAGYMAIPRALQSEPPRTIATAKDQSASGASGASGAPSSAAPVAAAPKAPAPAPKAPQALQAPQAPGKPGRLLVRSAPSGASVTVDGVARGETPLALRDLDIGTRTVTIARAGFVAETVKVSITKARPARTLDVRLAATPSPGSPKPGEGVAPRPSTTTPATLGKPAVSTGSLVVESRPAGATVTINGKPGGTTPLTVNDLPPGEYQIVMTLQGYRPLTTTVRVVAGERARAAASLTAVEQ
jgi:hypothetical protein